MNLYALLAAGLLWAASAASAYFYGVNVGDDHATAAVAREERIGRVAAAAATSAAASAISGIEVRNVTIQNKLQREVLTREVFRDCRSGDDAVRLLNAGTAIAAAAASASGGGKLPVPGAAR